MKRSSLDPHSLVSRNAWGGRVAHGVLVLAALLAAPAALGAATRPASATQPTRVRPADREVANRVGLGTTLLYAKRYDEAIREFEKALQKEPLNRDARLGLARAWFWSGRPRKATEALSPLMADHPDEEVVTLWNEVAGASGDTILALQAIRRSIAARPGVPELIHSEGQILVTAGCYIPAIKRLRSLLDKHPDNAKIGLTLALAYFTADRYPEAIALYRRFLDTPGPEGLQARLGLAATQLKSRRVAESLKALDAVHQRAPNDPRVYLGRLQVWLIDPENDKVDPHRCLTRLAEPRIRRQITEDERVRDWLFTLVGRLVSLPHDDLRAEVAAKLTEIVTFDPTRPSLALAAKVLRGYAENGPRDLQPDVEAFTARIRAGQVERGDVYEVANLLLLLYADESLIAVCDAALDLQPNDIPMQLFRAEGLAIRADYEEAAETYRQVLAKLPECSKAHRGLARTYSWHRLFDKAEETYNELIRQDPTDMVLRREAARSLGWDKQLRASLDTYDEAADSLGNTPPEKTWRSRLETEREAKHAYWWRWDDTALETYTEAIAEEPINLEARFDVAQIYASHRHWEEAAEQYHEILSIDARHRRARDALYKNAIYHEPELRTEFEWSKQRGRGDLLDIETTRLTETFKQEIARRTDLSVITTQMWHRFDNARRWRGVQRYGGYSFDEYQVMLRVDHVFDMKTYGHVAAGSAFLDGTHQEERLIWDAALTRELTDWLNLTVGTAREPWRKNVITLEQALDETRLYVELFGEIDPWLDLWVRYNHSWIDDGNVWLTPQQQLPTPSNHLNELQWGANYRFSLFPKVLQFEYRGIAWWFKRNVDTYFSPRQFVTNLFRLGWRHYLNNDQYFEQKNLYYELGMTASVDSEGVSGWGYDAGFGWDICHHFGIEAKWSQTCSNVYNARIAYVQIVSRF